MAHKLKQPISTCDKHSTLPAETQKLLREADSLHDIVLRLTTLLDFKSIALYVLGDADQICATAAFGDSPNIYNSNQAPESLASIATNNDWYFLPQGALIAGFKTIADELLQYNWHPSDVLCVPLTTKNIPLTAFLALAKPRENRVSSKNMQVLYTCAQWILSEIKNIHLTLQLSQTQNQHQRAEAALAAHKRHTDKLSSPPQVIPEKDFANDGDQHQQIQTELIQRNRELLSLQAAVAATASSLDVPFVLETVTWEVVNLLNVEGCTVSEWHQTSDTATIVAKYGLENWWEQSSASEEDTPCPLKHKVRTEKYAAQITINQTDIDNADRTYMQHAGIATLLVLPMIFQDEVLGVVEIFDTQHERVFSDREISLTQLLANQAATTLTNARLYRQAQNELKERKKVQEQVTRSLHEKEILLKEIHHRVKNNLQVISSLLFLQSRFLDDPVVLQALQESRARVQTMAMIHEKLYQSDDLARIDFMEYLDGLTRELVRNYNQSLQPVTFNFEGGNVLLDINISVPCGLIVNELVSNALKHAFPEDRPGIDNDHGRDEIFIGLTRNDDQIELTIRDNGVGIPADQDLEKGNSLGMQLVTMLTSQIQGTLTIKRQPGTTFIIVFPTK